jgi:transmembrane sensor
MVRDTIAAQAGEWFVANDESPLDNAESQDLVAWLTASPGNVEEFLGVAAVARDLHALKDDPDLALEALMERARADGVEPARFRWQRALDAHTAPARWRLAATLLVAVGVASLGWSLWKQRATPPLSAHIESISSYFATGRGQQKTYRLPDNSLLHLNTDSAVTVTYGPGERLVVLAAGEADFEVTHERRPFRVLAGPAAIEDLGTQFDVRRQQDWALVTVLEGTVAVRSAAPEDKHRVQLTANQQLRVSEGLWPASPTAVDAQLATAWLHRQIAFDREPLEKVAAEYNRYAPKPIEITTAELRKLEVSGTFSTDDPEELLAFLRSLEGVKVEVTATQIRVSPNHLPTHK